MVVIVYSSEIVIFVGVGLVMVDVIWCCLVFVFKLIVVDGGVWYCLDVGVMFEVVFGDLDSFGKMFDLLLEIIYWILE